MATFPSRPTKILVHSTTTNNLSTYQPSIPSHKYLLESKILKGTKLQFSTLTFSCIASTLFWTQIFYSLSLCRIHHNPICESVQQKIFFTETSFSTANFADTINLLNNKQAINSNCGIGNFFHWSKPTFTCPQPD